MRLLALTVSSAILVAALAQQAQTPNVPEPLATDFAKLSDAKSLKVHMTKRVIGETAQEYTLEMGKGNKFKLTDDKGFVLSDGTTLYTYDKAKNTYSQADLTPQALAKFRKRHEIFGWEAFLQDKPGSDLATVLVAANRTVKGRELEAVDVTVKPDNHSATYLIDPKLGITAGFTIKDGDKEYLVIADQVDLSTTPLPDKEFAFVAPEGSALAKVSDDATFASVQGLMNDQCMPCHSAANKKAGIDLTNYAGISAIVTPGQSDASLLIKAVKGDGVDLMPKGRAPLTHDQIAMLAKWIDAGAKNE